MKHAAERAATTAIRLSRLVHLMVVIDLTKMAGLHLSAIRRIRAPMNQIRCADNDELAKNSSSSTTRVAT